MESTHSTFGFFADFLGQAEDFRRALLRSQRISSSRELDRVAELTGDLVIEVGRITGRLALGLDRIVASDPELRAHLERFPEGRAPDGPLGSVLGGFPYLSERVAWAKEFARANAREELVRELNAVFKEALFVLNEVVLDHVGSLDVLMTEAFAQYGIGPEELGGNESLQVHRLEQAGKPSPHPSPVGAS